MKTTKKLIFLKQIVQT